VTRASTFEELLAKGISLQDLGLTEVALHRADALLAAEALRASSVPILGGDVYFVRKGKVEQGFANWHSDRHPDERLPEFVERSYRETRKYLEAFPDRPEMAPVFVFVVARGLE
jgi:Immunity protein 40